MRVQAIPLTGLVFDPKNPRLHDERNLGAIRASLSKHGQVEPLLVQRATQMVIAGNGRLEAMNSMGWEHAQCVLLDVDDIQARELSIALNRSGELASWNESVLAEHLTELASLSNIDLDALGFTGDEMEGLLNSYDEAINAIENDAEPEIETAPETTSLANEVMPPGTQPESMPSKKMREVKVFLNPDDYDGFQMAIRFLSGAYGTDNISDTICRAVKNAQETERAGERLND